MSQRFPFRQKVEPEQPYWEIEVFPYKTVNGVVVAWNGIVRRRDPGEARWQVWVMKPPQDSPEAAQKFAEAWLHNAYANPS